MREARGPEVQVAAAARARPCARGADMLTSYLYAKLCTATGHWGGIMVGQVMHSESGAVTPTPPHNKSCFAKSWDVIQALRCLICSPASGAVWVNPVTLPTPQPPQPSHRLPRGQAMEVRTRCPSPSSPLSRQTLFQKLRSSQPTAEVKAARRPTTGARLVARRLTRLP